MFFGFHAITEIINCNNSMHYDHSTCSIGTMKYFFVINDAIRLVK